MSIGRTWMIMMVVLGAAGASACGGRVLDEAASDGSGTNAPPSARSPNGTEAGPNGEAPRTGSTQWTSPLADVDEFAAVDALVATQDGGAAYASSIEPGRSRSFYERLDSSGTRVWRRTSELSTIFVKSLVVDPSGTLFLGGSYHGALDFGGQQLAGEGALVTRLDAAGSPLWIWTDPDRAYGGGYLSPAPEGGVFVSRQGVPITRLAADGSVTLARSWKDGPTWARVAPKHRGGYVVTGGTAGTYGAVDLGGGHRVERTEGEIEYAASYTADGTYEWDVRVPATHYSLEAEGIRRILVDTDDNVWIGGVLQHASIRFGSQVVSGSDSADVFVAKLDPLGHLAFARVFGSGSADDILEDMALDGSGGVVLTGSFQRTISFDRTVLDARSSSVPSRLFVAKLLPNGSVAWARDSIDSNAATTGKHIAVDAKSGATWLSGTYAYGSADRRSMWFLAKLAP